ncbi:MAG: aminoacyl-histidine dipeptidase [Lachnospiraceae bacterium]|nr:aminoacyl-histidine dipeptidase [Lachnospiraceae bacterium]
MLEKLQPEKVFYYFEQICRIPHGSGNTRQISDYLVSFARERKLQYYQDELNNVIIIKEASPGYEQEPPMMIQGHMDMVAVKEEDCPIDMEKEGLKLAVGDDLVYAEGTSLGADDGIAVAYALALLDSDTLRHPRLEVILTVDEEVGMEGALFIDLSMLKGKRLLNIDSETQGELTVSCAGGVRVNGSFADISETVQTTEECCRCTVEPDGLTGGHSGTEIHHHRANANILMGRMLYDLAGKIEFRLISLDGGTKDNVIPARAKAVLLVRKEQKEQLHRLLAQWEEAFRHEFENTDPQLRIVSDIQETKQSEEVFLTEKTTKLLNFLQNTKNGVQSMSRELPNLVETSLNLGIIQTAGRQMHLSFSIRSSDKKAKEALRKEICESLFRAGAQISLTGDYPAWELKKDSKLTAQMCAVYEELFGEKPVVLAVHAGLECGILADKIEGLDSVSFGPDSYDIHTTRERLSISSAQRMWDYLVAILERKM